MDTSKILAELRAERDQLNQAIAALESLSAPAKGAKSVTKAVLVKAKASVIKRVMSAAGRNRIAEAARKRWAAVRSAKPAPVPAVAAESARPPMSAPKKKKATKAAKKAGAKSAAKTKPAAKTVKPQAAGKPAVRVKTAAKAPKGKRRELTEAARKAMSEAAKARWAAKKAAGKPA
jgi:histone H1/5